MEAGQKAVLELSPHPDMPQKEYCFQIYVHFNGSSNGDIAVMVSNIDVTDICVVIYCYFEQHFCLFFYLLFFCYLE